MKKFIYNYKTSDFDADLPALLPGDALLFDIETTGLSHDHSFVYLIGCGYRRGEDVTIELFFAPTPADEAATLSAFFELAWRFSTVITYNGESFDIRFLRDRAKLLDVDMRDQNGALLFDRLKSIDLFKIVKQNSKYLNTPDCKQKTIEQYYGLFREDRYDGGQLIDIYHDYCHNPRPDMLETLLLHNHEDVKGMLTVMNILELSRLREVSLDSAKVDSSRTDELIIHLNIPLHQDITIPGDNYTVSIKQDGITVIIIPLTGELSHFYTNYHDYRYIPDEGLLIPKALASTIDKTRIEKATKENCCTKHFGSFLPVTDEKGHSFYPATDTVTFKKSYLDKQLFIEVKFDGDLEPFLIEYTRAILKKVL